MNPLNDEFRRLFVSSGWSQARAAQELRVDKGTVSRYIGDTVVPSETILRLFAEILGERLVLPDATYPASMHDAPRRLEAYEARLLDALRNLPVESRRKLVDAVVMVSEAYQARPPAVMYSKPSPSPDAHVVPDPSSDAALKAAVAAGPAAERAAGLSAPPLPRSTAVAPTGSTGGPASASRSRRGRHAEPGERAPS